MNCNRKWPLFLRNAAWWFVVLFLVDTAFTIWIWKEPYSLTRTLEYNLFLALVFAVLDCFFDPFERRNRMTDRE